MDTITGTIKLATPGDAPAISAAIARCYGDSYTTPEALDPAWVADSLRSGDVVYALAFDPAGEHMGQAALVKSSPAGLWECGRAIVDPRFRGQGVMNALSDLLILEVAPAVGARFVFGHLVTSHVFVQQHSISRGFVPTGLLLGMAPETLCPAGIARRKQPVSIVIALRPGAGPHPPRRLALAEPELSRALDLYRRLGVEACGVEPSGSSAPLGATVDRLPSFGISRLRFEPGGGLDLPALLAVAAAHEARVSWADVPVEHPGAARAIEALRREGFSWGALIPLAGPAGEDVLRLQRLGSRVRLSADAIHVVDQLQPLRDHVLADVYGTEVVHA